MVDQAFMSGTEIDTHIAWLESEISLCLEYDLPTKHLKNELTEVKNIRKSGKVR